MVSRRGAITALVLALVLSAAAARAQSYQVLHAFQLGAGDGGMPFGSVIKASDGNFYGTTSIGGANSGGIVFKMTAAGVVTTLHSFIEFDTVDGYAPKGGLVQGVDGDLYGTTSTGGAHGAGTVFKITVAGVLTTLYSLKVSDGISPFAQLIQATDSNFYGTTSSGGISSSGIVFKITPAGEFTVLHPFNGTTEGRIPGAGVIQASDGNFYGTTRGGGENGYGTVYKLTPAGTLTVVHSFVQTGASPEGSHADLLQAADGYLYGTTFRGGANGTGVGGYGTVFKMDLTGTTYVTLHSFASTDGKNPAAGLIQARDGNFYGTTSAGGPSNLGTVFRMDAAGTVRTLHFFATNDGFDSEADLFEGANGRIYGTTLTGGLNFGSGVVFRLAVEKTADFDGDGAADRTIFRPSNGVWYSSLSGGGSTATGWGTGTDIDVTGDYDGDDRLDIAVFRPSSGLWYIVQSSDAVVRVVGWGASGDIPVAGDVDGDGKDDLVIYRPASGTWFFNQSGGGTSALGWGTNGDQPLVGDFDGDGKADAAIYRPANGVWYVALSGGGTQIAGWGTNSDIPVIGDFDGDGKTDLTVFRPTTGQWLVQKSGGGVTVVGWGMAGDTPVSGDFDADGKSDYTVWRSTNGVWYTQNAAGGSAVVGWGISGDRPIGRIPGS